MARRSRWGGFTLLELLVVLVIAAIMLGAVSLSMTPGEGQRLHNDARRLALLLQLARDEAIVRNSPIAVELLPQSYRFYVRDGQSWRALQDELLRERVLTLPVRWILTPGALNQGQAGSVMLVFGREPVDHAFRLEMQSERETLRLSTDGLGHFSVE